MKKIPLITIMAAFATAILIYSSCTTTSTLNEAKSGAQLWGETCLRCHNAPTPQTFSDVEWDVAMMHMRIRANLTENEAIKIADFLKSAN